MSEQPEHNDALPEVDNENGRHEWRPYPSSDDSPATVDTQSPIAKSEYPTANTQPPIPNTQLPTPPDLTLAQTLDRLVRRPSEAWRVIANALTPDPSPERRGEGKSEGEGEAEDTINGVRTEDQAAQAVRTAFMPSIDAPADRRATLDLVFRGVGLLLAFIGTATMAWSGIRTEATALYPGLFFAVTGLLVWVWVEARSRYQAQVQSTEYKVQSTGADVLGSEFSVPSSRFAVRSSEFSVPSSEFAVRSSQFAVRSSEDGEPKAENSELRTPNLELGTQNTELRTENSSLVTHHSLLKSRLILFGVALVASAMAFEFSAGNRFTVTGVIAWIVSVVLWVWVFAPAGWTPLYPLRRWMKKLWGIGRGRMHPAPTDAAADAEAVRGFRLPVTWVGIALLLIIIAATIFRVGDLSGVPPEMTSDHVEKLLDSWRVYTGASSNIFFQNNGGREVLQMYVMAMFVRVSGLPFSFDTLKLLTAIEGIITIPVMFWLGRELFGRHDRRLGVLVGLTLAGLVAVSYWHVSLSRLALRIVYTPLITALIFIYLARALRENSRLDFINAGLALGVGLYMYQAVRMIPVVIVVGVGLAVIFYARTWLERRRYMFNFIALVVVAFAVFVPLFRFSLDYPDDFWRRSAGRIFGDALIQTTDDQGNIIERAPTDAERIAAVQQNITVLGNNIVNALLMFTWRGDIAFINAAPNRASFDPLAGALLFVGLGGFTVYMLWRRDPALWLVLPAGLIMILPSALAIAQPIENPSATRMSGTLPFAYLLAAFGMATMIMSVRGRRGSLLAAAAFIGALVFGYAANTATYFGEFRQSYLLASKPYSDAGEMLRVFGTQDGGFGNAFMIGYPHWWDHRAIGIDAGLMDYPNGIVSRDMIPQFLSESALRVDAYRFDPTRPILFMYAPEDSATELALQAWFPAGEVRMMRTYQPEDTYHVYYVPALGEAAFQAFVSANVAG
jgi:hypothetical protein